MQFFLSFKTVQTDKKLTVLNNFDYPWKKSDFSFKLPLEHYIKNTVVIFNHG